MLLLLLDVPRTVCSLLWKVTFFWRKQQNLESRSQEVTVDLLFVMGFLCSNNLLQASRE